MRNLKYFVAHQEEVKVKTFDELREAKTVDLQEASTKVKTTMPDKVASSAIRFGLKAKSQGGSVSISGPKGKLHNFLRAIIGRSSYGDASELTEGTLVEGTKVSRSDFDKLKKGSLIDIDWDGAMSAGAGAFKVVSKTRSEKYNVDKIKLAPTNGRKGVPFFLYSRKGGDATLAIGNMGATMTKYKIVKESAQVAEEVNLVEAADFEKMSKELLKKKNLGIEFEKAAAFARVMFMNSSLHVQDKAMKGLLTLIKGIDDLTVKTTLIKILKDNGFKVKGGRVMREEVELEEALQHVHTIKIDGNAPSNPKPFEVREIKDDFKTHVQAVRSAIKSNGGLVTDTESPSKSNNYVGRIMVGTRGDASKIDTKSIEKAVKRHGVEIHGNQFESVEPITENYRTLATHGMGAETKNSINVGRDVDYYEPKNGDKRMGKITKMTRSGYVVKDEKDGKSHAFAFHDRVKAKEILAKSK